MTPNRAIQLAVQLVAWCLSAGLILFLLPFIATFWLWNAATDFSGVVKRRQQSSEPGRGISRKWGTSRFLQLKVRVTLRCSSDAYC